MWNSHFNSIYSIYLYFSFVQTKHNKTKQTKKKRTNIGQIETACLQFALEMINIEHMVSPSTTAHIVLCILCTVCGVPCVQSVHVMLAFQQCIIGKYYLMQDEVRAISQYRCKIAHIQFNLVAWIAFANVIWMSVNTIHFILYYFIISCCRSIYN